MAHNFREQVFGEELKSVLITQLLLWPCSHWWGGGRGYVV